MQRIPAQFRRRGDVVDDGESSGHEGDEGRAHGLREFTAMASGLRGDFAPGEDDEGGGGTGGGRVQRGKWSRPYPGAAPVEEGGGSRGHGHGGGDTATEQVWEGTGAGGEGVGPGAGRAGGPRPGRGLVRFHFLPISSAANSQNIYCALL